MITLLLANKARVHVILSNSGLEGSERDVRNKSARQALIGAQVDVQHRMFNNSKSYRPQQSSSSMCRRTDHPDRAAGDSGLASGLLNTTQQRARTPWTSLSSQWTELRQRMIVIHNTNPATNAPEGMVRVSPGPFNTAADIDALADALLQITG